MHGPRRPVPIPDEAGANERGADEGGEQPLRADVLPRRVVPHAAADSDAHQEPRNVAAEVCRVRDHAAPLQVKLDLRKVDADEQQQDQKDRLAEPDLVPVHHEVRHVHSQDGVAAARHAHEPHDGLAVLVEQGRGAGVGVGDHVAGRSCKYARVELEEHPKAPLEPLQRDTRDNDYEDVGGNVGELVVRELVGPPPPDLHSVVHAILVQDHGRVAREE
mmetsp:Transcript_62846/g.202696  ORF Transcript_62846/g.202696 Transcript_62846/m.202696 type:complete len:218 (-) Transcript_62846:424-1077(-)